MWAVWAPPAVIHVWTALATNSGPLSERMWPGTPRRMNKSESTSMTSIALSLRSTRMARRSCVILRQAQDEVVDHVEHPELAPVMGAVLDKRSEERRVG